jgi:hypothetical protein
MTLHKSSVSVKRADDKVEESLPDRRACHNLAMWSCRTYRLRDT